MMTLTIAPVWLVFVVGALIIEGAVLPPPWADPKINPCATQPQGWQLLFWPPDGKCYRIFKTGYPCPDDMELSPSASKAGDQRFSAECRCPPAKAQSARDGKCYELYTLGPCDKGYFFAPDTKYNGNNNSKRTWGICVQMRSCPANNEIFWPRDERCYQKLTKGPCAKGQLITLTADRIAECRCNKNRELRDYRYSDGQCYQHFTRGPCKDRGHLFLPDRTCGCHSFLPHFHDPSALCFEIGTLGPCGIGQHFRLHPETRRGECECKPGYVRYANTSSCYRPFTQGPCQPDQILLNATSCVRQPCERGHLYFPEAEKCFRVGTRGPCRRGRLVTFDFETRPSIDGISYNGVCSCEKYIYSAQCDDDRQIIECDRSQGMIRYQKRCHKLYSQGPCGKGAWIAPRREKKTDFYADNPSTNRDGVCECVPGYTKTVRTFQDRIETNCMAPTVIIADYLNSRRNLTAQLI